MKFRKKPVVIEALKFEGWNFQIVEQWMGIKLTTANTMKLVIPTLEGEHVASVGDYIIKGVKGEFYPCKPDIFEMTYEVVE